MHPTTALMLVERIERERLQASCRNRHERRATRHRLPSRSSRWSEMLRSHRIGFSARP